MNSPNSASLSKVRLAWYPEPFSTCQLMAFTISHWLPALSTSMVARIQPRGRNNNEKEDTVLSLTKVDSFITFRTLWSHRCPNEIESLFQRVAKCKPKLWVSCAASLTPTRATRCSNEIRDWVADACVLASSRTEDFSTLLATPYRWRNVGQQFCGHAPNYKMALQSSAKQQV